MKLYVYLTYTHTYIHTYIHTHTHTYAHTQRHTYIHTYRHTYIPTYIHTYIPQGSMCPRSIYFTLGPTYILFGHFHPQDTYTRLSLQCSAEDFVEHPFALATSSQQQKEDLEDQVSDDSCFSRPPSVEIFLLKSFEHRVTASRALEPSA